MASVAAVKDCAAPRRIQKCLGGPCDAWPPRTRRTSMLKRALSACAFAVLAFAMNGTAYAQRASEDSESFSHPLICTWKSPPDEMPLSSAFDESVWGPGAKSVRTVELRIDPTGHGTLTVTKRVVDGRGRTVKASTSVEKAQLTVGSSHRAVASRLEHDVTVTSAVRTYP